MGVLVRDGLVSIVPAPVRNRRQRADIAVLCRYLPHHILPFSDLPQTWAKPKKVNEVPFVSGKNSPLNPVGTYVRVWNTSGGIPYSEMHVSRALELMKELA
jgi:hypothetical protein